MNKNKQKFKLSLKSFLKIIPLLFTLTLSQIVFANNNLENFNEREINFSEFKKNLEAIKQKFFEEKEDGFYYKNQKINNEKDFVKILNEIPEAKKIISQVKSLKETFYANEIIGMIIYTNLFVGELFSNEKDFKGLNNEILIKNNWKYNKNYIVQNKIINGFGGEFNVEANNKNPLEYYIIINKIPQKSCKIILTNFLENVIEMSINNNYVIKDGKQKINLETVNKICEKENNQILLGFF